MLDVVAERRHEQGEALPVRHGAEGPAEQAERIDGLSHVGRVGPAVVRVGRHAARDEADEVVDDAAAEAEARVEFQLPDRRRAARRTVGGERWSGRGAGRGVGSRKT